MDEVIPNEGEQSTGETQKLSHWALAHHLAALLLAPSSQPFVPVRSQCVVLTSDPHGARQKKKSDSPHDAPSPESPAIS